MATDIYKTGLFNDGEGWVHTDSNDAQRFLAARLHDQIFEKLIGNFSGSDPEFGGVNTNTSTAWSYCVDIGSAYPKQGSANNKIKLASGTLFQKLANSDGNEPSLLAYTFDGTDEFTLANGDATNPRVDMLQMKLSYLETDVQSRDFQDATTHVVTTQTMNKKRKVQLALSIKQGTPASSPTYPTPDTGYVPIACVVVGATYSGAAAFKYVDTAGAVAVLHDLRMPLNIVPNRVNMDMSGNGVQSLLTYSLSTLLSADNINGIPVSYHTRSWDKWSFGAVS